MPDPSHKNEALSKIREVAHEILYSPSPCSRSKIMELSGLTYSYDYMEVDRRSMVNWFERYESFKREAKKEQAWSRVKDAVYRLNGLANMQIERKDDGSL
ncbi:MAG TPA: hypothetical protein PKI20_20800 [Verrucomicrobiota bacterium]|jgi:hypothetical protein|nr:hypothetical protein [Verrucomicrobiota bacterium]